MFKGYKNLAMEPMDGADKDAPVNYPFGLSITLQNNELKALGLDCDDADCKVGNYIHLHLLAEVVGIHKTGENICLNLQATHGKVEDEDAEDDEFDDENGAE